MIKSYYSTTPLYQMCCAPYSTCTWLVVARGHHHTTERGKRKNNCIVGKLEVVPALAQWISHSPQVVLLLVVLVLLLLVLVVVVLIVVMMMMRWWRNGYHPEIHPNGSSLIHHWYFIHY
jgi:hypothetical protein